MEEEKGWACHSVTLRREGMLPAPEEQQARPQKGQSCYSEEELWAMARSLLLFRLEVA